MSTSHSEDEVAGDPQLAQSREADGEPSDQDEADGISTTGTTASQEFVGRGRRRLRR